MMCRKVRSGVGVWTPVAVVDVPLPARGFRNRMAISELRVAPGDPADRRATNLPGGGADQEDCLRSAAEVVERRASSHLSRFRAPSTDLSPRAARDPDDQLGLVALRRCSSNAPRQEWPLQSATALPGTDPDDLQRATWRR